MAIFRHCYYFTILNLIVMKKKFVFTFSCLLVGIISFGSINSYAYMATGWDYKSEVSLDRMDGRTYVVTHCESKIGDDCTTPGSASRIDFSAYEKLFSLI